MLLKTLFVLLSMTTLAQAGDPLLGWELEFEDKATSSADYGPMSAQANDTNDEARERWLLELKRLAKNPNNKDGFQIEKIKDWVSWFNGSETVWSYEVASFRVKFGDGFWFQLSYDTGVVEVQTLKSTLKDLKRNKERLQKYLFDTAKEAGLKPTARGQETHLHTGIQSAFNMDLKLIRNDLVSLVNHPEFPLLFAENLDNGPPLAALSAKQYTEFESIIADVDAGRIKELGEFVKAVRKRVYFETYDSDMANEFDPAEKFHQVNIERMKKKVENADKTRENRTVPMPQNAEELVAISALEHGHVLSIRKQIGPLKLKPRNPKPSLNEQIQNLHDYILDANRNLGTEDKIDIKKFSLFLKAAAHREKLLSISAKSCRAPH